MHEIKEPFAHRRNEPFSIDELETGLRKMDDRDTDLTAFWDENVASFRQTVVLAIRETSDALLSPAIPPLWRVELESQLESLTKYIDLADRYIASRSLSFESHDGVVRPAAPLMN